MTPFEIIYKRFESKIEDLAPEEIGAEGWEELKKEYILSALGLIELDDLYFYDSSNSLKYALTDRDDELEIFNRTLANKEIEEKWTNQKDHLNVLSNKQKDYLKRARSYYSRNAGRNNPYVNGEI